MRTVRSVRKKREATCSVEVRSCPQPVRTIEYAMQTAIAIAFPSVPRWARAWGFGAVIIVDWFCRTTVRCLRNFFQYIFVRASFLTWDETPRVAVVTTVTACILRRGEVGAASSYRKT